MECEICGKKLAKNSIKNGVQYYYCTRCKKSYSGKPHEPNHHIFEEYIARLLYLKCVNRKSKFTQTKWNINQIARLLGYRHQDVNKWANNENMPKIKEREFIKYIESRENGFDILCVLGYSTATTPSENLNRILHGNKRAKLEESAKGAHLNESEYLRLLNMPLTNRKEAIFVLGALLGCRTSEIIGVKYSDIDYTDKTIFFHRTVTFDKKIEVSEENFFITYRKYPLTQRMLDVVKWLKNDSEHNKQLLGIEFNSEYEDYLSIQENGNFLYSRMLNCQTAELCNKLNFTTRHLHKWKTKDGVRHQKLIGFQFKWLRYTVKLMMLKAGVSKHDVSIIFGYKSWERAENRLEIMRNAYALLDKYIEEKSKLLT